MIIENDLVQLEVNLYGGSFPVFKFKGLPVNPLNWRMKDPEEPPFMGHFLCFDRWGPPTEAEKAFGFVHHGEVNTLQWTSLSEPAAAGGSINCSMMCSLPMGGLQLTRRIKMPENQPFFHVTEEIKNQNKYGRMFNIVQHVTIAPPFLDKHTMFDCNAGKGFENKEDGSLDQETPVFIWPDANHKGNAVNLRLFEINCPRVITFLYDNVDEYCWVTACNPGLNLMLGYLWRSQDYPWINFWRYMEEGIPSAFGMEFGTTGLHEPFPVIAKKGKIFRRNLYDFIDAGEVITKSYTAFLVKIPPDYKGVDKISVSNSMLTIKEKSDNSRVIVYRFR